MGNLLRIGPGHASVSEVQSSPCHCAANLWQDLDEELGMDMGRLYGICVVHPRLL